MGLGIAFTFIFLAALLAPVVWVVWWAADSAGSRTPAAVAARPIRVRPPHGVTRPVFQYPQPADTRLPGRPDAITVYRQAATAPAAFCKGPDAGGGCPIAKADGTVPCAGCTLVLPVAVRGSRDWTIPAGYQSCLVGSYGALRQHA